MVFLDKYNNFAKKEFNTQIIENVESYILHYTVLSSIYVFVFYKKEYTNK